MFVRRIASAVTLLVLLTVAASCSWFSGDDDAIPVEEIAVFDAQVGDCFLAPPEVKAELPTLTRVDCEDPHEQELYAAIEFEATGEEYPGNSTLEAYAQGQCAEEFAGYVGIAYPDSGLWMTHLLPSARSWQQGKDRTVFCFITTTGDELHGSMRNSQA